MMGGAVREEGRTNEEDEQKSEEGEEVQRRRKRVYEISGKEEKVR